MEKIDVCFKFVSKLIALFLLAVMLCLAAIIWSDAEYLLAVLATMGLVAYIVSAVAYFRGKTKKWQCVAAMCGTACLVFYCAFVSGNRHLADDEDACADLGVCSERVMSDEKCAAGEGVWLVIGGERLCYLKWSSVREAVINELRDSCVNNGGVWNEADNRCSVGNVE